MSFSAYDVERRIRKGSFYMQVKSKDRIQHKAQRNKPLSNWEKVFNKLISKTRGSRAYFWESKAMVWRESDAFKRLGQGTHATYFGSHCLQFEAKSEDGNTLPAF